MKLYKKILLTLSLGMSVCSCLDLNPQDQLADGNLWKSADDFKYFANNFYGWTRDFRTAVADAPHCDLRSDLMTTSTMNEFSHGNNTIQPSDKNFTDNYNHIRRTNLLLLNAEAYSDGASISQYVSEAKFFRAYCYFDLVQLYGDALITKKPLDINSPEMNAKRNDRGEVIDFIIQDLREAASNLPEKVGADNDGRLTQWAAYAFLSRVALYEGSWQKFRGNVARGKELLKISADAAKEVIDKGGFKLFYSNALKEFSYKYMFILENAQSNPANLTKKDNREYIFYRRHDEALSPIGINITQGNLANAYYISRKFMNMYLCSNGLPIENNENFKGYSGLTTEFENRDNRIKNCLLANGTKYWANGDKTSRIDWKGMEGEDAKNAITCNVTNGSGYQNQKWATERKVESNFEGYDYPIIRYAEVLLNYAEAIYELYETEGEGKYPEIDTALKISLNLVRKRVNPDMPDLSTSFVKQHGLDMRNEIRRERTVELFHEGFRIDDLKRWKTAETEMPQRILGIQWKGTAFEKAWGKAESMPKNNDGCLIIEDGRTWSDKNYLYPLPADQRQLNPNLGQNKGWE